MDQLKNYFIILLSAGAGERMGKIGKKKPKSLFKIGKFTILKNLFFILRSRGAKEINLILGFKHKKILQEIKNIEGIKIRYTIIKDFINNGSVYSLYKSKNLWKKNKKKIVLMIHTDLAFDVKFLDEIINSKKLNIIGLRKTEQKNLNYKSFVAEIDKSNRIKKIGKLKEVYNPYGEILCINKFSNQMFSKLMVFLKSYFKKKTSNITWEYPMSDFAQNNKLYTIKNQNYGWVNINYPSDLVLAKKIIS